MGSNYPPAFACWGGKPEEYIPSEEEQKDCHWAMLSGKRCEQKNCSKCPLHPQRASLGTTTTICAVIK